MHRDVKPENILIASSGKRGTRIRVIDFGIALDIRDASVVDMLDETGNPGTPRYMSPEQWLPGIPVGPASDIFSLGLVTFEMLAGEPAFRAGDIGTIREQVTRGEFKVLGEISSDVPNHVARCVEKALSLDPQDRYESARDFAKALSAPERRPPTVTYRESVSARNLRDAVSPSFNGDEALASYVDAEPPVYAPRAQRPAPECVVAASLRALARVDIVTTVGMTSVELYLGDLLAIPRDWHVDVLAVTSLPDGFTAAPGTVSATIKKQGVDASRLTRDEHGAVHLSEPEILLRGKRHQGKPAAGQRIRGIELGDESDPKRQVDNMFRALGEMFGPGSLPRVVAMPLAELMADRPPAANVARPVLEAVIDWVGRGVSLRRLIVVESDPDAAEIARDALLNAVGR